MERSGENRFNIRSKLLPTFAFIHTFSLRGGEGGVISFAVFISSTSYVVPGVPFDSSAGGGRVILALSFEKR